MYGRTDSGQCLPGFGQLGGFAPPEAELGFDGGFVDQHDGNVVFDCVHAVAVGALEAFRILAVFQRLLTGWANEDFEEIFGEHDGNIVRHPSTLLGVVPSALYVRTQ